MTSDAPLPDGTTVEHVTYATSPDAPGDVLHEMPATHGVRARVAPWTGSDDAQPAEGELLAMLVPIEQDAGIQNGDEAMLGRVRAWVDAADDPTPAMMTTLQGVRLFWSGKRYAVVATAGRLRAVAAAVAEVLYYELELRSIQQALEASWAQMQADIPLAFEFESMPPEQRAALRGRFQATVRLSARLARIGPQVHAPHIHPPTLASQVNERLRERTQMPHRHELVGEQVEVFENVYEMCGQRASEFELATRGHTLEKVIIAILLAQMVFWGFDILTTIGS